MSLAVVKLQEVLLNIVAIKDIKPNASLYVFKYGICLQIQYIVSIMVNIQ